MYETKENFEYVVELPKTPKVAFGTKVERMSTNMWPYTSSMGSNESYSSITSATFSSLYKECPSKYGCSPLVSQTPRFSSRKQDRNPPVGKYITEYDKSIKPCKKPFNVGAALRKEPKFLTPAPTTYPYHIKIPDPLNYCLAFGTRRIIWPAVATLCSARNYMKCFRCQKQTDSDYYHNFNTNLDICRLCLKTELRELRHCKMDDYKRKRKLKEWSEFKLVRHCSFYHSHRNGKMILTLLPKTELHLKLKVENYLYPYYPVWDKRFI
ncbi:uncharacterized protein LOC105210693 [Zeugodacus cucurbitae]|nr:uncharacterized protein LOC105210693 [Zeugodacus cucurbitae]